MNKWLVRAIFAAGLLAQGHVVFGQSAAAVDLKDFHPREVKSAVFTLASSQDVQVEAVGAESDANSGTFSWVTTMWNGKNDDRRDPWMGNAWILDLKSRRVVWELSAASTERGRRSTRAFAGNVRLPAGTYEAFYSAFPNMYWTDEKGDTNSAQRFMNWLADEGFDQFRLTIRGGAQALNGADAERARHAFENGAVVTLRGDGGQKFLQAGFILSRPTLLDIYAEGEARENGEFDAGWIVNADTHEKIWKLTWRDSAPAGGAEKNRMAHVSKTLPAGRYAAFYATDDSHDSSQWNAAPPHDPQAWGLLIRLMEAEAGAGTSAAASVKSFAYEHVPVNATIVALTKVGDGESRSRGFTLNRAMDVRIYAIGEGRPDRLVDYGWITSVATHQKIGRCVTRTPNPPAAISRTASSTGPSDSKRETTSSTTSPTTRTRTTAGTRPPPPTASTGASRCWRRRGRSTGRRSASTPRRRTPRCSRRSCASATTRTRERASSWIAKPRFASTPSEKARGGRSPTTAGSRTPGPARPSGR
jgi:hypothetical protein